HGFPAQFAGNSLAVWSVPGPPGRASIFEEGSALCIRAKLGPSPPTVTIGPPLFSDPVSLAFGIFSRPVAQSAAADAGAVARTEGRTHGLGARVRHGGPGGPQPAGSRGCSLLRCRQYAFDLLKVIQVV